MEELISRGYIVYYCSVLCTICYLCLMYSYIFFTIYIAILIEVYSSRGGGG